MVIAVWAVLVSLLEFRNFFAEGPLALFAQEDHFHGWHELVVVTPHFQVALGAVKPLFAAWSAN